LLAKSPPTLTLPFGSALAFAAGIGAAHCLALPADVCASLSLVGGTAFLVMKARGGPNTPRQTLWLTAGLVLAWSGAGAWSAAYQHARFLSSPLFQSVDVHSGDPSQILIVQGWVAGDPIRRADRLRFLFQVERMELQGIPRSAHGLVRVSLRDPAGSTVVRYGDRLEMPLRLRRAKNFKNPGAFDYQLALESDGIHLLGTLKSWRLARRLPGTGGLKILALAHRMRIHLLHRLARAFPGTNGEESRRFLSAILLGARDGGEEHLDSVMRQTGVYHIVSISGLHFALLMALVGRVARRLPGGGKLEAPLLLLVGGLYLLLSGGEDPILRSALAGVTQALGRWTGRRVSAWNAQSLAGLALLSASPLHLFQPGFQLSFLATLGILAGRKPRWARLRELPLIGRPLAISTSAWIASTPVMACTFLQVSPVALIMNLVAGPFLTLSLAGGVLLLAFPSETLGGVFIECVHRFAIACALALRVPGSFLRVPPPSFALVGGLAALLLTRLFLKEGASPSEHRLLGGAVVGSLFLILFPPPPAIPGDTLSVTALDVGQGDSLLLGLPGRHWVLVDGGGFSASEFDVGERVVLPALLTMGIRQLDVAVLTHAHQDHGGGLRAVWEAIPPSEIWLGKSPARSNLVRRISDFAAEKNIPLRHPTRGSIRCFGETCLEVIHPPAGYRSQQPAANDDSLVLRVTYRQSEVLLTGDVESEGEMLMLRSGLPLSAQILKVAHHGSASSTSQGLLAQAAPILAMISVGEGNPWGHPSQEVIERLRLRGVRVLRTDREGAVQAFSDGKQWGWRALDP